MQADPKRVRQALTPPGQARDELSVISDLAARLGHDWGRPTAEDVWNELRSLSPNHAGMSYKRLEEHGGLQWPCYDDSHPGTLYLHSRLWEEPLQGPKAPFHAVDHDPPVDRTDEHPIVLAGGHAMFNPEPIADFLDAVVLGDGEEIAIAITELIREFRREGSPGGRDELLSRLAATGGVYVPKFYDVTYLPDGRIEKYVPNRPGVPWRVQKHTVMNLDDWPYPKNPIVPIAESVHERYSVEIFRGCTRGCRFCQAKS